MSEDVRRDEAERTAGAPRATDGRADPEEDIPGPDWRWRRAIRNNPTWHMIYRILVFTVGLVLVLGGLALVPLPGPGWLVVIIGIAVWATEFERAQRLLEFVKARVRDWEEWMRRQPRPVQGLVALLTFALVAGVLWVTFYLTGLPSFLPSSVTDWLQTNLSL